LGTQKADDASEHFGQAAHNSQPELVILDGNGNGNGGNGSGLKSLVQSVRVEAERSAIAGALEKTGWNRKAAARLLKVSYRTLLYKIEQYHMSSSDADPSTYPGNGTRGNLKRI
jgi:DNA-binding NtrC family response regulator